LRLPTFALVVLFYCSEDQRVEIKLIFYFEEIKATLDLVENFDQYAPEKWKDEPMKKLTLSNKIILFKTQKRYLEKISYSSLITS
jgi:hypothetical protein